MIKPKTWFDPEGTDGNHRGCGILNGLPHHTEFEEETGNKPDCMNFWYTYSVSSVVRPGAAWTFSGTVTG